MDGLCPPSSSGIQPFGASIADHIPKGREAPAAQALAPPWRTVQRPMAQRNIWGFASSCSQAESALLRRRRAYSSEAVRATKYSGTKAQDKEVCVAAGRSGGKRCHVQLQLGPAICLPGLHPPSAAWDWSSSSDHPPKNKFLPGASLRPLRRQAFMSTTPVPFWNNRRRKPAPGRLSSRVLSTVHHRALASALWLTSANARRTQESQPADSADKRPLVLPLRSRPSHGELFWP